MSLMFQPLKKYADFEGRARRAEYWLFALFQVLATFGFFAVFAMVGGAMGGASSSPSGLNAVAGTILFLFVIFGLGLLIPGLAVSVRRLHDSDKSGWWLLLSFVPFGGFVVLIFTLIDGTPGPNRYGPDPKGREGFSSTPGVVHHHHYAQSASPAEQAPPVS